MFNKQIFVDGFKDKNQTGFLVCNASGQVLSNKMISNNRDSLEAELYAIITGCELAERKAVVFTDCEPAVKLIKGIFNLRKKFKPVERLKEDFRNGKTLLIKQDFHPCHIPNHIGLTIPNKHRTPNKHNDKVKFQTLDTLIKGIKGMIKRKKIEIEFIPRGKNLAGKLLEKNRYICNGKNRKGIIQN